MSRVTVTPDEYSLVLFDATRIGELAEQLLRELEFPEGTELVVAIDETSPLARARVVERDPYRIEVESGAFEDPKRPRQLSDHSVIDTLGRLLVKERNRIDASFGAPDPDEELPLPKRVAWDVYAASRLARLGHRAQRQRWLYHFRNRCGFTDVADRAFHEIWRSDRMTWAEIADLVDGALAAREPAPA